MQPEKLTQEAIAIIIMVTAFLGFFAAVIRCEYPKWWAKWMDGKSIY